MNFFYNTSIKCLDFALKCLAPFNEKIKLGVDGRSKTFQILKSELNPSNKKLWFHCASLGEYEQGFPVFKKLREHYKNHEIILSFFSPSGYQIRKISPVANVVVYLPLDTISKAKKFLEIVKPELTVFVKYDIWPNFLLELKKRQKRAILISAEFRKNQPYFKFYGSHLKNALFAFDHIFTQTEHSKALLETIGFKNVSVSGDTRFDRVTGQLGTDNTLDFIANFKQDKLCIVAGSSWQEDEKLLINFINTSNYNDVKYIIAPHNIKPAQIKNLQKKLNTKTILYSEKDSKEILEAKVFIIDTIGLLSKIYSYADIAYVGGAMGNTGLHNTLEPAVFGVSIIIGKNYSKFPEAEAMINNGGMWSISNQVEFDTIMNKLITNSDLRLKSGSKNSEFIRKNRGAVIQILDYLRI